MTAEQERSNADTSPIHHLAFWQFDNSKLKYLVESINCMMNP